MPNRADPGQERKPGPLATQGQGLGGHTSTQGAGDWRSPPPLAGPGPIIGSSPSSSTLHSPKKNTHTHTHTHKNGKNHPGNSIWSRNLQGPWVPGSHSGGGGGQGAQRVGAQREGLRGWGGGAAAPGALGQDGHTEGQLEMLPRRATHPEVCTQALGKMFGGKMPTHRPGLRPKEGWAWKQSEAPRQGPLNL